MYAKDIMTSPGVLGCKIDTAPDDPTAEEKSVTVMYFYDPEVIEDVTAFEDSIKQYLQTYYPEADVVYTRGTPVSPEPDEFVESFDPIETLPADLNANWNFVPIVPNK